MATATRTPTVAPYLDKELWLKERIHKIGSSDVGTIFGKNEYMTPPDLWDRIVLGKTKELEHADIRRGQKQEEIAVQKVCEFLGLTLPQVRRHPMRTHRQYPFMVTDVDRMVISLPEWPEQLAAYMEPQKGPGAAEVKVPRVARYFKYRDEGLPLDYVLQHQNNFAVTGWSWGLFAFYTPEYDDAIIFPVLRDEEFIKLSIPRIVEWWEKYVVGRVRPERPEPKPGRWPLRPAGECAQRDDEEWATAAGQYIDASANHEKALMYLSAAEKQLTDLLSEDDTNVAGAGVKVVRHSTKSQHRQDNKKFQAAVKLAQIDNDIDRLRTVDPASDEFYYDTTPSDKTEFKVKPTEVTPKDESEEA